MNEPTEDTREEQKGEGCCLTSMADCCPVDCAWLTGRVKEILLAPQDTWPVIREEPHSLREIYTRLAMPLAAIPAICGFIGAWMFGSANLFAAVGQAIIFYILSLVMLYVWASLERMIAPRFEGAVAQNNALKHVAYAAVPMYLAGVLQLVPYFFVSLLALIVSLYGVYLWYVGIGPMTGVPENKRGAFLGVWFALVIVASIVIGSILAILSGGALAAASLSLR